jgi:rubrerythrin
MEMSIICSNLARGCEKQYLKKQAEGFNILSAFFQQKVTPSVQPSTEKLLELIEQDLSSGYLYGNAVSSVNKDRGALRCQAWSEKVTRMLKSLLTRYQQEGDNMLQNTGVYVCTICGFVYVGNSAPELCPVCTVPAWKFEKVEGRAN